MQADYESQAKVFKALCDPKRLQILEQLRGGSKCACILLAQMEIGQSGLSYHMKILVESGIVESWTQGKWTHYRLSREGGQIALALLREITTPEENETACHCG